MLIRRKNWFWLALLLSVVGAACLTLPSYKQYCESDYANQYGCAGYEVLAFFASFAETYNGAIAAVATVVVAWFTRTIYVINRNQLKFSRQVERAYVFARVVAKEEKIEGVTVKGIVMKHPVSVWYVDVALDNHGKTPAYVSELALSSCLVEELLKPADLPLDYERSKLLANVSVGPSATEIPTHRRRELREAAGKVMYGRVYYTDIFGDSHSSGFIYRVHQKGIAAPFQAPPEYTAWD